MALEARRVSSQIEVQSPPQCLAYLSLHLRMPCVGVVLYSLQILDVTFNLHAKCHPSGNEVVLRSSGATYALVPSEAQDGDLHPK